MALLLALCDQGFAQQNTSVLRFLLRNWMPKPFLANTSADMDCIAQIYLLSTVLLTAGVVLSRESQTHRTNLMMIACRGCVLLMGAKLLPNQRGNDCEDSMIVVAK
jgi:hypothetical protein